MQAEIITIGDEILIGQILDTNSKWISEKLNEIGISVYQITSVQDDKNHILKAVSEAERNADIIIITGGLGATKDDITKHTLVEYFDDQLQFSEEIETHIKGLFARYNYQYTDLDIQQALLPAKATILKNNLGTASGMWFKKDKKVFVSLPGVPNEMKGLMQGCVFPKLQEVYHLPFILHQTVQTVGLGESKVALRIESWENKLPKFIKLAYLPSYGRLRLRLSAKGNDSSFLEQSIQSEVTKLYDIIGDIIVGLEEKDSLEFLIQKTLMQKEQTVSVAESCTGGYLAHLLTKEPGASQVFRGSVVTYSAKAKKEILKVSNKTIEKYSVVSAAVAKEMAVNCRLLFETDYAIATTGNAGPTTDKTDKTVGVVFIALATPKGVFVEEFDFGQPREKVIERASVKGLEILRKEI